MAVNWVLLWVGGLSSPVCPPIVCLSVLRMWWLAFFRVSNERWKERERERESDGSHLFEDLTLEVT